MAAQWKSHQNRHAGPPLSAGPASIFPNLELDCTSHLFPPASLINMIFLLGFLMVAAAELLSTAFLLCMGEGGDNYVERWREARQPLCWTALVKHSPLPAAPQLQGSPVGLGSCPNWGLVEMTESARKESQFISQHLKIHTYLSHVWIYIWGRHKRYIAGSKTHSVQPSWNRILSMIIWAKKLIPR